MTNTTKVTRTEANDVISRHVVLAAIRTNTPVTLATIETEIEAFANVRSGIGRITFSQQWAKLCNPRSAYSLAIKKLRDDGREDLIIQHPTRTQLDFLHSVILAGGDTVGYESCRKHRSTTVIACREAGWIAPYEGELQPNGHVAWAPWTITDTGRDAVYGTGDYRR